MYPETRQALTAARPGPPVHSPGYDIEHARRLDRITAALEPREHVHTVADIDAGGVRCRYYASHGATTTIIHVHGGGFVLHDIDVHDAACRRLALRTDMAVLSVDYRLAPEHPFPAALDDLAAVTAWVQTNRTGLPRDGPLFIHGDSAGANLALTTALTHPGVFSAVALLYPFLDPAAGFPSYNTAEDTLDRDTAHWYWEQYTRTPDDLTNPSVAPLLNPDFTGLPPTLISTAELDPLRDEGEELARRIAASGVPVVATRRLGVTHGHWMHPHHFTSAEMTTHEVAAFFNAAARREEPRRVPQPGIEEGMQPAAADKR